MTGAIPITKNVEVVDLSGNTYAPTYIRRAKGLIKSGRARWSDEDMTRICLLVSPAQNNEEVNLMDINDNKDILVKTINPSETQMQDATTIKDATPIEMKNDTGGEITLSISYILGQMEKIRSDNGYIMETVNKIIDIESHPPTMNAADYGAQAKAEAIGDIIKARETTNQKLLATYEQIYNDIKPKKAQPENNKEMILQWASEMMPGNQWFGQSFGIELGKMLKDMYV